MWVESPAAKDHTDGNDTESPTFATGLCLICFSLCTLTLSDTQARILTPIA